MSFITAMGPVAVGVVSILFADCDCGTVTQYGEYGINWQYEAIIDTSGYSWYDAEDYCIDNFGTALASFHNDNEYSDFEDARSVTTMGVWSGLQLDSDGNGVWSDGSSYDYVPVWDTKRDGEPLLNDDTNCVRLHGSGGASERHFQTQNCDRTDTYQFICVKLIETDTANPTSIPTSEPTSSPTSVCDVASDEIDSSDLKTMAFYRWYHISAIDHFYTTDSSGELAGTAGYTYEGIGCYLFDREIDDVTVPLYRWYHGTSFDHFYTTDSTGELAPSSGYTYEGVAGYVMTQSCNSNNVNKPLYRWYHSTYVNHFYTTSTSEPAAGSGYIYEGVAAYVAV